MYSPTCQYALRALTHLAGREGQGPVLARDIAEAEEIPRQFLSKILHGLRIKGLVRSQRGPGGGYALTRPATEITVADVVLAIDGEQNLAKRCILGLDQCHDDTVCALHSQWSEFRERFEATISSLTLREMHESLAQKRLAHPATSPEPSPTSTSS
jgi:Rrf2 family iron-sulfur cluster assembly transcriptional regulator